MMPKILVGCPTSEHKAYALERYANGIKGLTYHNFDVLLVDNSKNDDYLKKIKNLGLPVVRGPYSAAARQRIVDSRNILRQKILDGSYDYFFSLEQDVIPPPNIMQKLLSHNKKIMTGVYFTYQNDNGINSLVPLLWKKIGKDSIKFMSQQEVLSHKLVEIAACGLGCALIHKSVLEKVRFRYDKKYEGFDDIWFCYDSFNAGFKIFADTSVKCKHLIKDWSWKGIKE